MLSKEDWLNLQRDVAMMVASQTEHSRIVSEVERRLHTNIYVMEPYATTWQIERMAFPILVESKTTAVSFTSIHAMKKSFLIVPIQLSSKKPFQFLVELQQMPVPEIVECFIQTFQLVALAYNQRRILWKQQVIRNEDMLRHYFEGKVISVIPDDYANLPCTIVYGKFIEHTVGSEQKRIWDVLRACALQLEEHHLVHTCFRYDHGMLFIIPLLHESDWQTLFVDVFEEIRHCLRIHLNETVRFGISNAGVGDQHFLRHIEEAVSAARRRDADPVTIYDQKSLSELLELIPQGDLIAFTEHILKPFDVLGMEERKLLIETLDAYLECHCQISETAKTLFIHRNTVIYRLEKCQSILEMDIKHPDITIQLRFALRLRKALLSTQKER